jgi:pyruvate dehydrogenase E1 component
MYQEQENVFFYLTVGNENYPQPPMPEGSREGILKGIYRFKAAAGGPATVQLFGSGSILNETSRAQAILAERYQVQADVWSVTSYSELRREALAVQRWNRLHPAETPRPPYLLDALGGAQGPIIAATDYMKIVADQIAPWLPGRMTALGTDGFGRSETRKALRDFFEVDSRYITLATLSALAREGKLEWSVVAGAMKDLDISPDKLNPMIS